VLDTKGEEGFLKPRHARSMPMQPAESANAVGLRYVNDGQSGIHRRKAGAGFAYADEKGRTVTDESVLRRIRSLAIPPAWTDVWICPHENGHLQATGRDAKKRKQHRYHPLWREVRDATKYERMIDFGNSLPRIRKRVTRDLQKKGLSRERVLATIVRLMDLTCIRVGNEEYAKQNQSYGLTTMQDQHAKVRGNRVRFTFKGKSGKHHAIEVEDRRLAKIVKNCQDIPGQDLFQYYDVAGVRHDISSGDVNDYLREISGSDFTAKDFRTWSGTVLAAQALSGCPQFETQRQAKKNLKQAIEAVAEKLGNTPAVCRKSYIHPFVIEAYNGRKLPCTGAARVTGNGVVLDNARPSQSLAPDEQAVLELLKKAREEEIDRARRIAPKVGKLPPSWRPRLKVTAGKGPNRR
jgi:DNA topoisomerase-1